VAFFPYAFVRADTIRYELPEGFAVEALPDPLAIDVPTLRFSARADIGPDGVLLYTRRIEVTDPVLPAEYYDDLRDALLRIARAHRSKAVLVAQ
jgi:hypothetical protein